jgi:hypothetical protein
MVLLDDIGTGIARYMAIPDRAHATRLERIRHEHRLPLGQATKLAGDRPVSLT